MEIALPAMVNAMQNNRSSQNDRTYSSNTEVFTDDLPERESKQAFYTDKMPRSAENESDKIKLVQT
jgi:hypothetical protein